MQFLIGVFIFQEEFGIDRLIGFGLIWLALVLYSAESLQHRRRTLQPQTAQFPS